MAVSGHAEKRLTLNSLASQEFSAYKIWKMSLSKSCFTYDCSSSTCRWNEISGTLQETHKPRGSTLWEPRDRLVPQMPAGFAVHFVGLVTRTTLHGFQWTHLLKWVMNFDLTWLWNAVCSWYGPCDSQEFPKRACCQRELIRGHIEICKTI